MKLIPEISDKCKKLQQEFHETSGGNGPTDLYIDKVHSIPWFSTIKVADLGEM